MQVSATFSSLEGQVQASATRQLSSTGGQLFVGPDSGEWLWGGHPWNVQVESRVAACPEYTTEL